MAGRRQFGTVRLLVSGRYQARYRGPDGVRRAAPETFARRQEALRWLALAEAQVVKGEWRDPAAGKVALADYGSAWIAERPGLRPRTVELYRGLFGKHIAPHLGRVSLADLDPAMIRAWRRGLLTGGVSATTTAKAYRLLRAILTTAAEDDEVIRRNPCRIRGAGTEPIAERPTLTPAEVLALARTVPARYSALVLLVTYASLRWGEAAALRRCDLDLVAGTVEVRRTLVEMGAGQVEWGPPKSRAGYRTVAFPCSLVPVLAAHLDRYAGQEPSDLVFSGPKGAVLRRSNFRAAVRWSEAVAAIGRPGLHFHDLRHTGNTLASRVPGTSLRDLMDRMGHDSPRAAMIYMHGAQGADRAVADGLPVDLGGEEGHAEGTGRHEEEASGTQRASDLWSG